jgi:serine/threonine protein kinase
MTRLPGERTNGDSTPPPAGGVTDARRATTQIRSVGSVLPPLVAPIAAAPSAAAGSTAQNHEIILEQPSPEGSGPVSGRRMAYASGALVADKYRLLRPLGSGGMGEVWVAHHLNLDIDVAVKFIGDVGEPETGLAERLLEEARNTARLGHPAIVRALDFGHTERGDPFIVLELLAGEDLASRIDRVGPLTPDHAVAVLLPVVHALQAVHESGIVHRDIKPENVFLAEAELGLQAKLLDFGISRKTDRARRLTVRDTALGTPDYMSPEQARGENSDARTDQWSFCVVLYEALTRQRPFEAVNYNALLRAIIEDPPRPLFAHGVEHPELWQILARGLSKAAADRYPTIRDLGEALAGWLVSRGISEDAVGTSLRRAWLKENSAVFASPTAFSETEAISAVNVLERASTQMQLPLLATSPTPSPDAPPISVRIRAAAPAATSAQEPVTEALEEALKPAGNHSVPDLEALAELHRGGDPEERLHRDAQRRVVMTLLVITLAVFATALAILVGTGVIVW